MKHLLHYLELTLPTLAENVALDEALLLAAEHGGPQILRIWEWPTPAVVLGAACRLAHDVRESACRDAAVPIVRRSSGGGTVLLDAGCLLYSLVLRYDSVPELRDVTSSYRWILGKICTALASAQPGIAGISDLTLDDRKFSGNAQQRKRDHLLHHGSILYAFDQRRIGQYLNAPERQPEYRQDREHADFVTNLGLPRTDIVQCLRSCWQAEPELVEWPAQATATLVAEKYSLECWIRRR